MDIVKGLQNQLDRLVVQEKRILENLGKVQSSISALKEVISREAPEAGKGKK